jgi:hypothetical protein
MEMSMIWSKDEFSILTDKGLLQFDKIHKFLSQEAYRYLGIPKYEVTQTPTYWMEIKDNELYLKIKGNNHE